mgnify:CR=1 FL=1
MHPKNRHYLFISSIIFWLFICFISWDPVGGLIRLPIFGLISHLIIENLIPKHSSERGLPYIPKKVKIIDQADPNKIVKAKENETIIEIPKTEDIFLLSLRDIINSYEKGWTRNICAPDKLFWID